MSKDNPNIYVPSSAPDVNRNRRQYSNFCQQELAGIFILQHYGPEPWRFDSEGIVVLDDLEFNSVLLDVNGYHFLETAIEENLRALAKAFGIPAEYGKI